MLRFPFGFLSPHASLMGNRANSGFARIQSQSIPLTILRKVFIGLLSVSDKRLAGGFFGLDEGVCTAQHLMKIPIRITKAMLISITAHQYSCNKRLDQNIRNTSPH